MTKGLYGYPPPGPNKHQSAVTCLQFCRGLVLSSSDDGTVKLWDLKTGAWLRDVVALQSRGSGQDLNVLALDGTLSPLALAQPLVLPPTLRRRRRLANPSVRHAAGLCCRQQERNRGD